MFVFCWGWGSQRMEAKGQWKEISSQSIQGAPETDKHTSHTCICFFFITKVSWHFISKHIYFIWSLQNKFWCALPLCLKGFERLPCRQYRTTFNMAPAALMRTHGLKAQETNIAWRLSIFAKLGSQKWLDRLYYCPIFPVILSLSFEIWKRSYSSLTQNTTYPSLISKCSPGFPAQHKSEHTWHFTRQSSFSFIALDKSNNSHPGEAKCCPLIETVR